MIGEENIKKMTTRRRTSLPAVCRCLPSDKSEASGETRRAGTWRWWRRRGDGRRSHSLCVIWGNLQINTTAWCSEPLSSPTSPHCISPSLPSPPLPPFSQPSWLYLSQASFISLWLHFWGMHGTGENYQWQRSHRRWKIDARNSFKMIMEILQGRSLGSLGGGIIILPSTGGCYDSSLNGINLLSSFPLRDTLTDISVSRWGLKVHGGSRVELLHTAHTRVRLFPWTVTLYQYTELEIKW